MAEEVLQGREQEQEQTPEPAQEKREKSKIQFAYLDLDDAVAIASGVHEAGGTSCPLDRLAGQLGVKADTGSFRLRVSTAKLFGFITISGNIVTLTDLGIRVCDPQQKPVALGEAFIKVPLYRQIYDQFKGGILPNQTGLEAAMVQLGVASKQSTVARQVFTRSAQQAGYFQYGNNRLVSPRGVTIGSAPALETGMPPTVPPSDTSTDKFSKNGSGSDGGDGGSKHPFIQGLLRELPEEREKWPMEKRVKWLRMASGAFDMMYEDDSDTRIEITLRKETVS